MKVTTFKTLACVLLVTAAFSCKKSSDDAPAAKTNTELIMLSAWKVQKVQLDADKDGTPETDASSMVPACDFDNTYTFKTGGTGTADEGLTKCNSGDPQSEAFSWSFKSNETILAGSFSFFTGDATIKTLNETNLVFSYDYVVGPLNYKVYVTLQH